MKIAGYFALMWILLNVVPSAVLYTEVYCNDGTTVGGGNKMYCEASRGTIHIIQCMYYWMMTAIVDLYLAIVMGAGPQERDTRSKFFMVYSCLVPLAMLIWNHANQVRDIPSLDITFDGENGIEYPNLIWNKSHDFFTCSPRLRYFYEEFIVVWVHFLIGAIVIVSLLFQVIKKALITAYNSGSATSTGKSSGVSSVTRPVKWALGVMRKSGSANLMVLGSSVTILLMLQLAVMLTLFPQMDKFSVASQEYEACAIGMRISFSGNACLADSSCCEDLNPASVAPDGTLMAFGFFFPISAITLVYGIVCSRDKNQQKAWRQYLLKKGLIGTSTVATSGKRSNNSSVPKSKNSSAAARSRGTSSVVSSGVESS